MAGETAAIAADLAAEWTSVGVMAPETDGLAGSVAEALDRAGLEFGRGARAITGAPISLVSPAEAKGLEFDGVIVVEPAAFRAGVLDDEAAGRLLYVALTRGVQELVVVHAQPLPLELVD